MVREREFYDACRADNLLRAREILSDDVNIDWVNDLDEHRTALHAALQAGAWSCVTMLVDAGADLEIRDDNDKTVLHLAISIGDNPGTLAVVEGFLTLSAKRRRDKNALMKELSAIKGGKKAGMPRVLEPVGPPLAAVKATSSLSALAQPKHPRPAQVPEEARPRHAAVKELPADSVLLTPRELPEGSIRDQKRKNALEGLVDAAKALFASNVTANNIRQIRLLDDPPAPLFRLVDAMCFIGHMEPPRTWPEMQNLLRQPSFKEALAKASPTSFTQAQAQQIKQCTSRLDDLLGAHKLPPAPYAVCAWVLAFEKASTFAITYPVR